jgi:hypothetical protein
MNGTCPCRPRVGLAYPPRPGHFPDGDCHRSDTLPQGDRYRHGRSLDHRGRPLAAMSHRKVRSRALPHLRAARTRGGGGLRGPHAGWPDCAWTNADSGAVWAGSSHGRKSIQRSRERGAMRLRGGGGHATPADGSRQVGLRLGFGGLTCLPLLSWMPYPGTPLGFECYLPRSWRRFVALLCTASRARPLSCIPAGLRLSWGAGRSRPRAQVRSSLAVRSFRGRC